MSQPWHNETFVKRFWAKVPRERDPAKCWLWLGYIGPGGYGKISLGPRECWAVGGAKAKELPLVPVVVKRGSGEVSSSPIAQVGQDAATVAQTSEEEEYGES